MELGKRTFLAICFKKWSKEDKQRARLRKNNRIDPLKKKQYKDPGIIYLYLQVIYIGNAIKLNTFKDAVQTSKLYCLNLPFSVVNHKVTKTFEQKKRKSEKR